MNHHKAAKTSVKKNVGHLCWILLGVCLICTSTGSFADPPQITCPNNLTLVKAATGTTGNGNNYHYDYVVECDSTCDGSCKRITQVTPDIYTCVSKYLPGIGCKWISATFDVRVQNGKCVQTAGKCTCTPTQLPVHLTMPLWTAIICPPA